MKRFCAVFVTILTVCCLSGCGSFAGRSNPTKLNVIATLFPQYDFAREIAKDKADVTLLLPPGTESHTYEPTPVDIVHINTSDLFLYTGKHMEPWAEKIAVGAADEGVNIVDVSTGIDLMVSDDHDHEGSDHHGYDPHIWLDMSLACRMVDNIKTALCQIDPANESYYEKNAIEYKEKLNSIDTECMEIVGAGKRKCIVFGGRFAHLYFVERYGLEYMSAFDGCSADAEPSLQRMVSIVEYIKENNIPCIYYEEFTEPKIVNSIVEQTGIKALKFSTAHNITKDQFDSHVGFVDIMQENLRNLKVGLN